MKVVGVHFEPEFFDLMGAPLSGQELLRLISNMAEYLPFYPDVESLFTTNYVLCSVKDTSGADTSFGYEGFNLGTSRPMFVLSYHCFIDWDGTGVDHGYA
jgi:hypothetical protein